MIGNKITTKKINKECNAENLKKEKKKILHLPRSYGCPTNPFHPFFLRI
jgi:hypothetical protein